MRLIFMAVAISAIFSFCSKKNDITNSYSGTWELRNASGMIGYREYPEGNGNKLIITEDSLYTYTNNTLQHAWAFHLVKDTLRGFGEDRIADKLSPDLYTGLSTFFELQKNTLTWYAGTPALDGGSSQYVRLK